MNYFKLFNLEEDFEINKSTLENAYFNLQKKFHPDQQNNNSDILNSVLINDAYKIIKDDYLRSAYILKISDNESQIIDEDFLEEILSISEVISENNSLDDLIEIKNTIEKSREDILEKLSFFHKNKDINNAKKFTNKLKYFDQLLTNLDKKLETCF